MVERSKSSDETERERKRPSLRQRDAIFSSYFSSIDCGKKAFQINVYRRTINQWRVWQDGQAHGEMENGCGQALFQREKGRWFGSKPIKWLTPLMV